MLLHLQLLLTFSLFQLLNNQTYVNSNPQYRAYNEFNRAGAAFVIGNCYLTRRGKENSGTGKSRTTRRAARWIRAIVSPGVSRGLIARRESRKPTRLRSSPLSSPTPRFFSRRPSLPALAPGATSTLDLEHVPRTRPGTATCERRAWACALCLLSRLYALADRSRDVSSRCEKGDRRWRRLILPRAGLFRKAKDDKGQSARERSRREGAERSLVYSSSRRSRQKRLRLKITTENCHT